MPAIHKRISNSALWALSIQHGESVFVHYELKILNLKEIWIINGLIIIIIQWNGLQCVRKVKEKIENIKLKAFSGIL